MVARIVLALALLAVGASATNFIWNGKAASFTEEASWVGGYPGADDSKDRPSSIVFGSEQNGKTITANVPSQETAYVGLKIEFKGAGKIVLGDGSSGKTKLSFEEGKGGVGTFIPGSGLKFDGSSKDKLQAFDLNCHRNWVPANAAADGVALLPPCGRGDRAYIYSKEWGKSGFDQPSNIKAGDMIFASNFGKNFDANMYVQRSLDGTALTVDEEDCVEHIISTSVATLDLRTCGNKVKFGSSDDTSKCATTCPPFAVLEDGSYIQSDRVDKDGNKVYTKITAGKKGVGKASDDVVEVNGETITVTSGDGVAADYVKDGKGFKLQTTTTAADTTTGADGKFAKTEKPGKPGNGKGGDDDDDDNGKGGDDDDDDDDDDKAEATLAPLDANAEESSSGGKKDDSSSTIIIVVVVVVILIFAVIGGALFYIKSQNRDAGGRNVVSFENPMYDTQGQLKQNPVQGAGGYADSAAGGYQDVQANQQGGTYAEPMQQQGNSGYMDVQPSQPGAGGATGGYMDVAPTNTVNVGDENDGDDV